MTVDQKPERPRGRGPAVAGVVFAVLVIVGGYAGLQLWTKTKAPAEPSAACSWQPIDASQDPYITATGTPPTSGLPAAGARTMTIATTQGTITVTLDVTNAPCSAASFTYLASRKYFDNTACHRLTTTGIYVLQCGDPTGTGKGYPSYTYAHENLPTGTAIYPAGTVAMANPGNPDANGSQFFIVYQDTPVDPSTGASVLSPAYTVIGKVTAGLDVVQRVGAGGAVPDPSSPAAAGGGKPKLPVTITTLTVGPVTGA
jgi:peptidyl-prolyl cis-trans isomerase B (cyclophilin B)